MSLGLVNKFCRITLCILLGCKSRVFLYFEIAFLQFIEVYFIMILHVFFLAVLPMVPSSFIHSSIKVGSLGGFGIFVGWWFCRLMMIMWILRLVSWVITFMAFLMVWEESCRMSVEWERGAWSGSEERGAGAGSRDYYILGRMAR
jgi:hypothetical protein